MALSTLLPELSQHIQFFCWYDLPFGVLCAEHAAGDGGCWLEVWELGKRTGCHDGGTRGAGSRGLADKSTPISRSTSDTPSDITCFLCPKTLSIHNAPPPPLVCLRRHLSLHHSPGGTMQWTMEFCLAHPHGIPLDGCHPMWQKGLACRHGVLFSSTAGGAYWPIAIHCPSVGHFPSIGGGAHRPLTTLCGAEGGGTYTGYRFLPLAPIAAGARGLVQIGVRVMAYATPCTQQCADWCSDFSMLSAHSPDNEKEQQSDEACAM